MEIDTRGGGEVSMTNGTFFLLILIPFQLAGIESVVWG